MNEPFREELERWARRPPERPAPVARVRVLAQIESRRIGLPWKLPVAAVLLAGLALGLILGIRRAPVRPVPPETPSQSLVVFQLQSGTKVYLVMKGDPL
jgi:hypothetical protein